MTTTPPRPPTPPPAQWFVGVGVSELPADAQHLCLVFDQQEVMSLRVGRAADDLMHLIEDEQRRRNLTHGLTFSFIGWDADPRPIHQIQECRHFLQALHAQWPYWLHFLMPDPDMWRVLLLSLLPQIPQPLGLGATGTPRYEVDSLQLRALVGGMLPPMQLVHEQMKLFPAESNLVFDRSLGAIKKIGKPNSQ